MKVVASSPIKVRTAGFAGGDPVGATLVSVGQQAAIPVDFDTPILGEPWAVPMDDLQNISAFGQIFAQKSGAQTANLLILAGPSEGQVYVTVYALVN